MFDGGKITKWKQGDYEFSIRAFNPFYAMRVLGDLQKILVPVIGGAAASVKDAPDNTETVAAIGGALRQAAESLDGVTLEKTCKLLLDSQYIGVKAKDSKQFSYVDEDMLAQIYWGRPWDMLALCAKVFEVNYLDFTKSSSVPTGVIEAITEIRRSFRGDVGTISGE